MKKLLLLSILLSAYFILYSQDEEKLEADKYYSSYSYKKSIRKYEAIKDKDLEIKRKLALAYYNTGDYVKSKDYWKQVAEDDKHRAEDLYNYASVLAINEEYEESEKWMSKFHAINKQDSRAKEWSKNSGFYKILQKNKGIFTIENININSPQQDFGTSYFGDKIVYASSREKKVKIIKRIWNWNQLPFLDIYVGKPDSSLHIKNEAKFRGDINHKLHEGPAAFNKKGDFMVLTRNNYEDKSSDNVVKLQLFSTVYKDGKWQKLQSFKFNSKEYSVGHASLTSSGDTMYFASDMPGGYGGTDLYVSYKRDGQWTNPENLGNTVNTEGDEMFPFIHQPTGMLLFASNGHSGLGGLDVFVSRTKGGQFTEPENLGVPINSSYDDFAFIMDGEQKTGYFSSNRPEGKGDDDIYSFIMLRSLESKRYMKGRSFDNDSNLLASVEVILKDKTGKEIGKIITEEDGVYAFEIVDDMDYSLSGTKETYSGDYKNFDSNDDGDIVVDLLLIKNPKNSLCVLVKDAETGQPLQGVQVESKDMIASITDNFSTSADGKHCSKLIGKKINDKLQFDFNLKKEGYLTKNHSWTQVIERDGEYTLVITMEKMIKIDPIYYDFDKSNIRNDATARLNHIVDIMNKYPNIEIEFSSHTDCRGSDSYNMALSKRRAKSAQKYIRSRIKQNPERISGEGYGETRLANECDCNKNCSKEEHQLNRRTEFVIVKYN